MVLTNIADARFIYGLNIEDRFENVGSANSGWSGSSSVVVSVESVVVTSTNKLESLFKVDRTNIDDWFRERVAARIPETRLLWLRLFANGDGVATSVEEEYGESSRSSIKRRSGEAWFGVEVMNVVS